MAVLKGTLLVIVAAFLSSALLLIGLALPSNFRFHSDYNRAYDLRNVVPGKRVDKNGWYVDSPAGIAKSIHGKTEDKQGWYVDSPSGIDKSLHHKPKDKEGWYVDSPSGIVKSLHDKSKDKEGWYVDSPSGIDKSLYYKSKDKEGWYVDSPSGIDKSLHGKSKDKEGWYTDSPAGVSKSLHDKLKDDEVQQQSPHFIDDIEQPQELKRAVSKEDYEISLRSWIYGEMRTGSLRDASDRSSTLFTYEVHPRDDVPDRWNVPIEIQEEYAVADDARRVSLLNFYLMVTGREPRSAAELGFTPTADKPGLVEENEVGYGYAYTGQHQHHCVDFVADAVEKGRDNISDFYMRHTVHCLGLLKANSRYLTRKEPVGMVRGIGRHAKDGEDISRV